MQTEDIKYYIIKFLRNTVRILKETKSLPNFWKYVLLAIVLTVFFLLLTFPYNMLIRNQLQTLGEKIGRNAYIGDINFSLIDNIKINEINLILKNSSEISLQNSDIDIGLFSAILQKSIKGNANIQNIKYTKDNTSINTVLNSDFDLNFNSFSEYPNGELKVELQNIIANGITIQGFEIPPVRFSSVTAKLDILKNKVNINDIIFTGPDLRGRISGSMELANFLQQSLLNLNISIDSSSALLENYKILLERWIDDTNKIQLKDNGTISNPKINSKK